MMYYGLQRGVRKASLILTRSFSRVSVRDALDSQVPREGITVSGWLTSVRQHKDLTFLSLSDGSSPSTLQLLAPTESFPSARKLNLGCAVAVNGVLVESTHPSQRVELQVSEIDLLGECDPTEYPLKPRVRHSNDYIRSIPHLRARTNTFSSLLRIRNSATMAVHDFFQQNGFINCHTPILSSSDCEGAGKLFEIQQRDTKEEFFGHKTFLTVSGQLHAEALASGMSLVYTFGPTFRAERSRTRKHLSEFYMVEAEMGTLGDTRAGLESLMELIEQLVVSTAETVREKNKKDVELFDSRAEDLKIPVLSNETLSQPFIRMSYGEAIKVLQESNKTFDYEPKWGCDLQTEHEQYLVMHCGELPLFITDFPASIKPFYAKSNDDGGQHGDTALETAASLDLLVPGVGEIVGGTVREERYHTLERKLESEGKLPHYQWYLDLRKFGTFPHGGFGLGFERLLQAMLGIENIRDTIPFPRFAGSCQI